MPKSSQLLTTLHEVLNFKLFSIAGTQVSVLSLFTALAVLGVGYVAAGLIDNAIARALRLRRLEGGFQASRRLLRYAVLLTSFGIAMNTVGINVSALFAAGAIFAVGLGFAMQNIAQNFVSGVILLVERSIKPGDIVKVDGKMVKVEEMGIRATIARTRDDEELIIPNSALAQSTVINYSLTDKRLRIRCNVGVSYDSDMKQVRSVLEAVGADVNAHTGKETIAPVVTLLEFADSSVVWELSVWVHDPWGEVRLRGAFLEAVWQAFADAGITIAYPQLDVHFDKGRAPKAA